MAGTPFTSADTLNYFADGNAIHSEFDKTQGAAQIYIDANHDKSFEAASDLVIQVTGLKSNLVISDFHFL